MFTAELAKADGRRLTLYARRPMGQVAATAPTPFSEPLENRSQLRWHPLRGEWVTYAAHRQNRTFQPPPEYDPLAPTHEGGLPTEVPAGDWDVAVFDNRFPALGGASLDAPSALAGPAHVGGGHCEVVVYTPEAGGSLGALPLDRIELLLEVWADRTVRLAARGDVAYVFPFENRGAEVGATLPHPHGQIYAYPVVPPVPARMAEQARGYRQSHGRGPLEALIEVERTERTRLLYEGPRAVAFVPMCARYPYEAWVAPIAPVPGFAELDAPTRADLARAMKTVLLQYDGLWQRPMPYLMAWYQAPTDPQGRADAHLHAEFWPAYRSRERLKYLAGTELGAGLFTMDALPEAKARELQAVDVRLA